MRHATSSEIDAEARLARELHARGYATVHEASVEEIVDLAVRYAIWIPVAAYRQVPWLAPFAVRRIRIRTEPNAHGPKRDLWGLPTEDGYFSDDNSLIKPVPLRKPLSPGGPYGDHVIRRGLVCCHIWSGTTQSPLLFSFVPNLVWLPRALAPFSDGHLAKAPHPVHDALKAASIARYRDAMTNVAPLRAEDAWRALPVPTSSAAASHEQVELAESAALVKTVRDRLQRYITFMSATLQPDAAPPPRFSKRYHAGVGPGIDTRVMTVQQWLTADRRQELLDDVSACLARDAIQANSGEAN